MNPITKILIVEHNPNDIEFIQRELKMGGIDFISETVQNEPEYRKALKNFIPDIILSDYSLPSFNGQHIFEIREEIAADTPFIFVSGSIGEENSIEYLKKGVTDYVLKDKLYTLTVKVKRALKDAKEKQEKNKINIEFHKVLDDLQKITDASLDVICAVDVNGCFLKVSAASETVWGYKPEELIGKPLISFVYADDREKTQIAAANVMAGNDNYYFENRYIHKNGSVVPIEWSVRWDAKDKVRYGVARDATRKKKLEIAFENERKRFYDLFLQAPSCMGILKGPEHVFEMANPLYLQLINKTDILDKAVKEVLPEIVDQGFIEILDDVYNTGKTFSANEMLIKLDKDGNGELVDLYLNFIYQAYRNNEGSIEGIFFFAVDVTEQVISRKKIEESENRFRALIEHSTDMKTLVTGEGKLFYASPSITKILGYTIEEFINTTAAEIIHPDDISTFSDNLQKILPTAGSSIYSQQRLKHKSGNYIWCEGTITNMLHEPYVNAMVSNFRDISKQKKEEELREFDRNNLDALINSTTDLMWSVDRDFKLITSNKPFDDAMMFMSGRVVAKEDNILDTNFSSEQKTRFAKSYERAFAGESFTEIEYTNIPAENWSEISYCPINNGDEILGVACHSRDITQLKMNEKTIKDERILLRTLIDNLPAIIYTKDVYSKKTLSNYADYKHLGAESEEEVLGKDDSYFFSKEVAHITAMEERQIFYSGESICDKEEFYKKKDATVAWLLNTKIPLRNQHNEIVGLIGISHDITERKGIEQALKKSEAFNRGVLNSLSSHIAVIDATGNIVAINEAWKRFGLQNGATAFQGTAAGNNYYKVCEKSHEAGVEAALEVFNGIKDVMEGKSKSFYLEYPCHSPKEQRWFGMRVMKFDSDEPMAVIAHENITVRKLAEENLLKSKARLQEAQTLSHISNWEVDLVTGINTWSDEFYNILGIRREDVEPSPEAFLSYIHPDDFKYAKGEVERTFGTFEGSSFNVRIKSKEGTLKYVYGEWKFEFDKKNKPIRLYGILQDITKEKLTENDLRQSENRFREFFDSAPETIVIFDITTFTFVKFNDNATKLFNYSADELLKMGPADISPEFQPDGSSSEEKAKEFSLKAIEGKKPVFEWMFIDANGKEVLCEVRLATLSNIGSSQLLGSFIDITERKKSENKLVQSEARLIEAQSIAHIGNWEVDLESNTHTWSDEYHNILGITKEEAHPSLEYYLSFIYPEDVECVKTTIQANNNTLKPIPYDFRFIRKDGIIRYGYAQSRFEFDKNNKPVRLYGIVQDITERKLAELKLEQQNAELAKTNFELDRFVYSVSHDLRSPLTSVLGVLSFIEEESKEPDTLEYAEMIRTNINRLDGFIKNILNYSRNKRIESEVQKIDLQKTITEIVDSLHHMKDAEGIDFEVNMREHQAFYSDLQTFSTIIENLISNAIKFQKEQIAGKYIKISGTSDKRSFKLTIEDNGIGIAPEHHDNIFKMFFRLSGKTGGSGIGLYIVKEMIEKLHGSIQVNSTPGTGTSFTIKLKNLTPVINTTQIHTESKFKKTTALTSTIRNFIVLDDDPDNNMICVKVIKKVFPQAYVLTFTNPDAALVYITSIYNKKTAPDTVFFLDINMPELSGWEFLDAFDKFDIRIKAHLKIYMLTSSVDQRDKERAAENKNILGYFEKPLNREKLASLVTVTSEVQ